MILSLQTIWILSCVFGVAVTLYNLREAQLDRIQVEIDGLNGALHAAAVGQLRRERLRLVTVTLFLVAGVVSIFAPPPPGPLTAARAVTSIAITVGALAVIINSYMDTLTRLEIRHALDQKEEPSG